MKHKFISIMMPAFAFLIAAVLFVTAVKDGIGSSYAFTWRWFAIPLVLALCAVLYAYVLLLRRTKVRRGAVYWLAMVQVTTMGWLIFTLLEALSANPQTASFWQSMQPMAWVPMSVALFFFTMCYVDEAEYPLNIPGWLIISGSFGVVIYLMGMTNLVESHVSRNPAFYQLYGYLSESGQYQILLFAWAFIVGIVCIVTLARALKHEINDRKRIQLKLFIIGITQYLSIGFIFDILLYSLNIWQQYIPPMAFLYSTILSLIISYAVIRHGMFHISPTSLAQPILQNLSEAVFGLNSKLVIEFANAGAKGIFGHTENSLKGMSIKQLFGEADYSRITQHLHANEQSFAVDDLRVVSHGRQDAILQLYANKVFDEHKKHVGYILVLQDITALRMKTIELAHEKENVERKVVERTRELHEEQARLRASIEDLALGFIMVNEKNEIIVHNKALSRIVDLPETLHTLSDLHLEHFNLAERCAHVQKTHRQVEAKEVRVGEKILHIFITPVVIKNDKTTKAIGTVILVEDITEVKVLERSRDEFFSIASHELRTPLTVIRGNASMALDYYNDELKNPELHQLVDDIHDSSVRLIDIVSDFLDMSRLEQGKIAFELGECAIDEIIERIVYELRVVANEKKISINADVKLLGSLPTVWADKNRTKQILYNIVGNAVKFTEHGSVDIETKVVDKMVKVIISDSGRGIPSESRKLLFHKFQQAGDSLLTRDTTRGTGLGLYVSRLLARKMGGDVVLEESVSGKGSVFSVSLPITTDEDRKKVTVAATVSIDTKTGLTVPSAAQ
jgi:two-component system phosphate regulon sensor histidine kinase PhoR